MVVTNIEAVTKAKYKVYIDGEYAFILYKKELSRYHVAVGCEIKEAVYKKIYTEVVAKRAKLRAMHLLNDMGRTQQQLEQKLERDGYTKDIIDEAISYVKSFGYVDDENYARIFIEGRKNKKSRKEIFALLVQKGIDREVIEGVFEQYYEEDDDQNAIAQILKKKHYDPETADRKEKQKIFGYLTRKGFRSEDIFSVSEKLDIFDKTV
ncbi:MAG: regulatory protein RecX [Dorea sp.]|jgi:regulatory protein|nr:regulatory protein RecX [Dorea sp.]